jgi:hypothetical protein
MATASGININEIQRNLQPSSPAVAAAAGGKLTLTVAEKSRCIAKAEENSELLDECEVLKSIYEGSVSIRRSFLCGTVVNIIDLSIQDCAAAVTPSSVTAITGNGGDMIRIMIYNAAAYPGPDALILGWIAVRDGRSGNSNPTAAHHENKRVPSVPAPSSSGVSLQDCRNYSINAMHTIQQQQAEMCQPCVFDLIQLMQTSLAAAAAASASTSSSPPGSNGDSTTVVADRVLVESTGEAPSVAASNNKQGSSTKGSKQKQQLSTATEGGKGGSSLKASNNVASRPPATAAPSGSSGGGGGSLTLPVQQLLQQAKLTELPEYRSAFLQALNEGLTAQNARNRARALLEYVLP